MATKTTMKGNKAMIDYLQKIKTAKDLETLATYIRAFAFSCRKNIINLHAKHSQEIFDDYENDAQIVLSCKNLKTAKSYLRDKGYGC